MAKTQLVDREFQFKKIGLKGEVVVPKHLRREIGLNAGNLVRIMKLDDMLIIKKVHDKLSEKEAILINELEKAQKSIRKGRYKSYSKEEYIKKLRKRLKR